MKIIAFTDRPLDSSQRRLADLPDRVVEGDPQHQTDLLFRSPDGVVIAGIWTSTPGKWHAFTDRDEFCHIIKGRCALISTDGERREFTAGQSFMIPDGFTGYWEVIETTTKHFVIREH
ncbi:cupin domain-containing protein [Paracoccus aminovorans]|uniref:cupin domain-containing protein n=1 Tax=Paracoccus aminovorans TaxID=34004 RepID=UPI002B25E0D0|nr:cupin domain-containing protein [Paracoccus aminovorans]